MKKFFRFLVVAALACFFAVPAMSRAEAAKVAVLPLINMEQEENNASAIFMKQAVEYFKYPSYELVGDEILEPILKKENYKVAGQKGPNEGMLRRIMNESKADIIIMMRLTELEEDSDNRGKEMLQKLEIEGEVMALNAFTNKLYDRKIDKELTVEYAFVTRTDWKHDEFAKICRKTFKDIAKGK